MKPVKNWPDILCFYFFGCDATSYCFVPEMLVTIAIEKISLISINENTPTDKTL
jgi:hypothetical protein